MIAAGLRRYAELVRLSHTVFALPFALTGVLLAGRGVPPGLVLGLAVVAVVGARTAAMAFNRLVDRRFDARNPRTARRALPAGTVSPAGARALVLAGALVFLGSAAALNRLTLQLAPAMLVVLLGYSLTKRVTWLCHAVLGGALALAPLGGWVAVRGRLEGYPLALSLGVLLWVAGFDIVYACLDEAFDREAGLHSVPARWGRSAALWLARLLHVGALLAFLRVGQTAGLGQPYRVGLAVAGMALLAQHVRVGPGDLERSQTAFFALNGLVSVVLCLATWLGLGG